MGIETVALVLAGASAVGTGVSIYKGQQADKANRKAADLSRRQEEFKALRERRDFIRQARSTAARINQSGTNQGAARSSAAEGGLASIISQAGGGLSFLDQYNAFSTQIGAFQSKANKLNSQANMWSGVADLAATGAKATAGGGGTAPKPPAPVQGPPI